MERWKDLEEEGRKGEPGTSGGGGQVKEVKEVEEGRGMLVVATCLSARFTVAGYLLVLVVAW